MAHHRPKAREFEEKFAAFLGADVEAVAVNSATAGLHLAAEACGIGPGDEVIVPTLTFTATASVIRYLGAEVVLVDVEESNRLHRSRACRAPSDAALQGDHAGPLRRAFLVTWLRCQAFARRHGLKVIEDAAHAMPARVTVA